MGRPKKRKWIISPVEEGVWHLSHTEQVIRLMEEGYFDYQIMAVLNISAPTWKRWQEANEDFKKAVDLGKPKRFHWWMTEGRKRYEADNEKGYKFWTSIMSHMFHDIGMDWGGDNKRGTQINIQVNQQHSASELLEQIKANFIQLNPDTKLNLIEQIPEIVEITNGSSETKSD